MIELTVAVLSVTAAAGAMRGRRRYLLIPSRMSFSYLD
jgi:hypothetical protein